MLGQRKKYVSLFVVMALVSGTHVYGTPSDAATKLIELQREAKKQQEVRLQDIIEESLGVSTNDTLLDQAYQSTVHDLDVIDTQENNGQSLAAIVGKGCRSTLCKKLLNRVLQKRPNQEIMSAYQRELQKLLADDDYVQKLEDSIKDLPEIEQKLVLEQQAGQRPNAYFNIFEGVRTNPFSTAMMFTVPLLVNLYQDGKLTVESSIKTYGKALCGSQVLVFVVPYIPYIKSFVSENDYVEYCKRQLLAQPYKKLFARYEAMEELIEANPGLNSMVKDISDLIDGEQDTDYTESVAYLEHFLAHESCEPSILNFLTTISGRDFTAVDIIKGFNKKLALRAVKLAYLDMLLSIKQFIQTHNNADAANVCFADFDQKQGIELTSFWNPFIDSSTVVTNDISLANNNPQAMILTGPNTGGKSTVLKGVMLNALLGMHFGIATARSAKMPYFDAVLSSVNVKDNTAQGTSLFQGELDRAKLIQSVVNTLAAQHGADGTRVLIAFDELFKGTSEKEAAAIANSYLKGVLDNCPMCPTIFATHFHPVAKLAEEYPTQFKNFHVKIAVMPDGSLKFYYTLAPGINKVNIAKILARKQLGL